MANVATIPSTTTATPGPLWCEFTNAANMVLNASGTNSGATVVTVGLPTAGAGFYFSNTVNLPISMVALNQANIQGALGTGLPAGVGIANVVVTNSTTLSATFINSGAATNINANTRFLLFQENGV
jgi:hypothetical protein